MTVSTESAAAAPLRASTKRRPARELVIAAFFGPLAHRLALALLPTRIPPPAVVLAAGATGLVAGLALALDAMVAAALLLQLKTLLDNTDGGLARLSGRVTLLGRYLDSESDTALNLVLFAILGLTIGRPVLALAAFVALTIVLSVDFNLGELYREVRDEKIEVPSRSGGGAERALELVYRGFFAPQDRLIRAFSSRRLARALRGVDGEQEARLATLAYHDRFTLLVLANLGLSTQLVALGVCLLLGVPAVYFWLVLASLALLPVLQLRRELLVRRRRAA
ncbi:MAG: CDP-alcohol phosphatidyltransferase family protein [Actinomycetota bacterium]|nr:CDP-alcohol phosphatidyltransferase family protein [Actinomycetota bacterium]